VEPVRDMLAMVVRALVGVGEKIQHLWRAPGRGTPNPQVASPSGPRVIPAPSIASAPYHSAASSGPLLLPLQPEVVLQDTSPNPSPILGPWIGDLRPCQD
jgi:hypothetical protein